MMMHETAPYTYHNEYKPCPAAPDSVILHYGKGTVLARKLPAPTEEVLRADHPGPEGGSYALPTLADCPGLAPESLIYLFAMDERRYYLAAELEVPAGFEEVPLREPMNSGLVPDGWAAIVGSQLDSWYASRRFCGRCGQPMVQDEKERMMRCPACGVMEYPKICPGVIVGVRNGEKLLMSRYAGRPFKNYALLAGFTEIGEPIEDTIRREVMEEVGLRVKNITFYRSQPWPFSNSLLCGFYCDLDGDDTIRLDESELAEAVWFERKEIPVRLGGGPGSLTHEMIERFALGRDKERF